jgi:hypothetical protein
MQSNGGLKWAVAVEGDKNKMALLMGVQTNAPVFVKNQTARRH